jgi:hypothetical protein
MKNLPSFDYQERWRPVDGFAGLYEVSNFGRVRSIARWIACREGRRLSEGRILRPKVDHTGYLKVTLCNGQQQKPAFVHRLVAEAFVPGCGDVVRHLDGDSVNARADNLAWGSHADNEADKKRHDRVPIGERHPNAKVTDAIVRQIRALSRRGFSQLAIADATGINRGTVGCIARGERWAHVV